MGLFRTQKRSFSYEDEQGHRFLVGRDDDGSLFVQKQGLVIGRVAKRDAAEFVEKIHKLLFDAGKPKGKTLMEVFSEEEKGRDDGDV